MKYLYLTVLLLVIGCKAPKKEGTENKTPDFEVKNNFKDALNQLTKIDRGVLDPKQDLIVLVTEAHKITETKGAVNNNGLVWDKSLLDKNSLREGFIRIPADKKDIWLNKLIESGELRNVKLYSEKFYTELNKLSKKDDGILDDEQDLVVLFQNPDQITETIEEINSNGLLWDKTLLDLNFLKDGIIKVPSDKKNILLNRLIESGELRNVKIFSEDAYDKHVEMKENALLNIKKTPCFGDCPVYEVSIDKNGNVLYRGIKYVLIKGVREFKLTDKELSKLKEQLSKSNFANYNSKYDNPKKKDLPSTLISHKGQQVEVRLWKNVPSELINVHEYVQDILLAKKYFN